MKGRLLLIIAGGLLAASCAHERHWSPYGGMRSEDWHTGKMMIANFDTNNDGTVTRRELEAGLRQAFWQADTNRDGRLDPDEAIAANVRRIEKDQSTAIPLIDWNQDGYIDFGEFANGARSQFKLLDTNDDGQVTPDEFRNGARQL